MHLLVLVFGVKDYNYSRHDFPHNFVFGSGSSAYQVEGAAFEDGRTPSIWDTFAHAGFHDGATGDIACDSYHKYKEDVQRMVDVGLEAYRFSISWSRLIPNGRGPVNPKGLQYYNNLIDELISHGIQPHVTLYHCDLPQALEDEYVGWVSRKIVKDFTAFADVCFKEFGDRVLHWTTINEANILALGGYDQGILPPNRCSAPFGFNCSGGNSSTEIYIVGHNMLLAHSSAVRLYQRKYKSVQQGFMGINIFGLWCLPYTNSEADVIASQRALDFYIGWFIKPLIFGDYPQTMRKNVGSRLPTFTKHESELVKGSLDFIGLNHYSQVYVRDNPSSLEKDFRDFHLDTGVETLSEGYQPNELPQKQPPVTPSALSDLLEYFKQDYGNPPIYVHENGQQTPRNGTLYDTERVKYLHAYIGAVLDALRNGSNTRGYFQWAFLDGLELLSGYKKSFGLFYVDLDDKELTRYPKLSAFWYSNFLKRRNFRTSSILEVGNKVEGAAFEDGRTPSIWDTFAHAGFHGGATGDIACDSYHKYKEDVQLMADVGLEAYRFSISWSRLIPNGRGPVNPKGLQYYNNLIDELISHGIQPHVTLYHCDLPQALEDEYVGWVSRKIVKDFTAFADVCFKEFGDRVLHWTTINEANILTLGGYDQGLIPPKRCSAPFGFNCTGGNSSTETYIVGHNMLLAHSSAVRLYQKKYKSVQHGFVGINVYGLWFLPYTNSEADVIAVQRALDFYIGWFIKPLIFGDYPQTMKKNVGSRLPAFTKRESELVKGSLDFIGLNHYTQVYVRDNPSYLEKDLRDFTMDTGVETLFVGYQPNKLPSGQLPVRPSGLSNLLEHFKQVYGNPPIYVHENGQRTPRNGTLYDLERVEYLHAYIGAVLDALRTGSNTRGYFQWSFLDGLEILGGYETSFGLFYVDLDDKQLTRYPKLSAFWYSNFLKRRCSRTSSILEVGNKVFASAKSN
ncbi:hypothetical protein HAX54_035760 [Datura stramonium]|uniref:Beta-glucosidase 11-like n=1 Tax=Datura stramonium TaxID=4076 RepID=A0ABS8VFW1_DATST|nr:hypothetical protein [Datura stramonium]